MEFNLEHPLVHPPVSNMTPTEVIDLTRSSTALGQLNLDRPHHKASSLGLTLTTPPTSINLEHPLRKAKSAQSYSGLPHLTRSLCLLLGGKHTLAQNRS